jgi:hypothetical protein
MSAAKNFPGIEYDAGTSGDIYLGRPEALIAAGLIEAAKVPGAPGMPRSSITFVEGVPQPRGAKPAHDERWMQATMYGRQLRLTKGISLDERRRREQQRAQKLEDLARTTPKPDIGHDGAAKAMRAASAIFNVGDSVIANGDPALVIGEYTLRRVICTDGQFLVSNGERAEYRPGYVCRYRSGEEYFFPPHQVTTPADRAPFMRLVVGSKAATRPALAFGGQR